MIMYLQTVTEDNQSNFGNITKKKLSFLNLQYPDSKLRASWLFSELKDPMLFNPSLFAYSMT